MLAHDTSKSTRESVDSCGKAKRMYEYSVFRRKRAEEWLKVCREFEKLCKRSVRRCEKTWQQEC